MSAFPVALGPTGDLGGWSGAEFVEVRGARIGDIMPTGKSDAGEGTLSGSRTEQDLAVREIGGKELGQGLRQIFMGEPISLNGVVNKKKIASANFFVAEGAASCIGIFGRGESNRQECGNEAEQKSD